MEQQKEMRTYRGEDGLLYCAVCGEAREMRFSEARLRLLRTVMPGLREYHPRPCACQRAREAAEERRQKELEHRKRVAELSAQCFGRNSSLRRCTFGASTVESKGAQLCRQYVQQWPAMVRENMGMLLWGDVGTGKSFMAACIANALLERDVSVRMLNLSEVLNATFDQRARMMEQVSDGDLLILDDFGMERENDFGMEITFRVVDARYQSGKPLIVTTNLPITAFQTPRDTAHKRIYDRILEMCLPVKFEGSSLRGQERERKRNGFRALVAENSGPEGNGRGSGT